MNSHVNANPIVQPVSSSSESGRNKQAVGIGTATDLVEIAKQIQDCEQYVSANACARLHLIVKQMQCLKVSSS